MKKILYTLTSLVALEGTAFADTTLKLTEVLTSPERTETLKTIVKTFEDANPGVHVEITSLPWGQAYEKLAVMVSAGDTPDVVEMPDRWQSFYVNNGALENLEPYLAKWTHTAELNDRTLQMGRYVGNTAYSLPYGFYLRAMFYNKNIFRQAGIDGAPKTMDDMLAASKKISALPGKYGYCMRGGPGGLNAWAQFGAGMQGDDSFFKEDGTSTFTDDGWVKGFSWIVDLYENGYAPKDAVNWGFNETVAGFYSSTCAMLDQDPDALIAIAERMKPEEYGVAPFPKGPAGKAFPTLGYAGWSIFANSKEKDLAWKLIATLNAPEGNLQWSKRTGTLPIYTSAEADPFFSTEQFKGWFEELNDKDVKPMVMPFHLKEFAFFSDSIVVKAGQQAILGQITPAELAQQWSDYMTKAQKAYLDSQK